MKIMVMLYADLGGLARAGSGLRWYDAPGMHWLAIPLVALLCACSGRTDADWYTLALTAEDGYARAARRCDRIDGLRLRGDCEVAAMSRWGRLEEADCQGVEDALWRDECVFLLAERQWGAGQHQEALASCHQTRFARACVWHLLQDEVEATATADAHTASTRLAPFAGEPLIPDAQQQFWRLWLRSRAGAGIVLDEAECADLADPWPCRHALDRYIHEVLEALHRADASICALPLGQRVMRGGTPQWRAGALAVEAEERWALRRCARN